MENDKNNKRILYFDILRIIAIFAVIFTHVATHNWLKTDVFSFDWNVFNIYRSISKFPVIIFIMISGALFLSNNYSLEKIYEKHVFKIITSFIFWSSLYTILFHKHSTLKLFFIHFFKGEYHLWFLYMIIGLYICVPFFKKIVEDEFLMKYFLILSFIFAIIIPQIVSIVSVSELKLDTIKIILKYILNNAEIHFVLGYSFYFILGYYLHKFSIDSKKIKYVYILGILGFLSTIIFSILMSRYLKAPNQLFFSRFTVNLLLEGVFIFILIKNCFKNFQFTDRQIYIITNLSKHSFGIYLVHVIVLNFFYKFSFDSLSFNPIFSIPVISIITFFISFLISVLFSKIPFLNKYIV